MQCTRSLADKGFIDTALAIPGAGEDGGGLPRLAQRVDLGRRRRDPCRDRAHPGRVGSDACLHAVEDVGVDAVEGIEGIGDLGSNSIDSFGIVPQLEIARVSARDTL